VRHGAPLDLVADATVTLMCAGVVSMFIVVADPVWIIADTAATFAPGTWLMWRRSMHLPALPAPGQP
jgi:hypothetical protein